MNLLMKKAQLMSQPFVFIFTIVVIAMVFVFGAYMIYKLLKTECQVENKKFLADLNKEVNRIYSVGYVGNSEECAIVKRHEQTNLKCEMLKPSGVKGLCFIDLHSNFDARDITIKELRDELVSLRGEKESNLYFTAEEGCELDSEFIAKLSVPEPICMKPDEDKPVRFILENQGNKVAIKKA